MASPIHSQIREEIAAIAARFIAEDGMDYANAKRRAVRELTGASGRDARATIGPDSMPDNAMVEAAVRTHQSLFMADVQPARLSSMRRTAAAAMRWLAAFSPRLTGAVMNGTAGEHSDIHLHVIDDNAKDIEIFLINEGLDFDAAAGEHVDSEVLSFRWPPRARPGSPAVDCASETIHLTIVPPRKDRASRSVERIDLAALEALIDEAGGGAR